MNNSESIILAEKAILSLVNLGWTENNFDLSYIANNNSTKALSSSKSGSSILIKYTCDYCHKTFIKSKTVFNNRKQSTIGECPNCAMKYKGNGELLKTARPDLLKQWDYEKNKDIILDLVKVKSHQDVWWICTKDNKHRWHAAIGNVTRTDNGGCPFCYALENGTKEEDLYKSNLFIDRYQDLIKEWNAEKNTDIDMNTISYASHKKVWWKCKYGHEWQATVKNRTLKESVCPKCSIGLGVSKIDLTINYYLTKAFPDCVKEANFLDRFWDNYIPSKKIIVEFDGGHWHNNNSDKDVERINAAIDNGYNIIKILDENNKVPRVDNEHVKYILLPSYTINAKKEMILSLLSMLNIHDIGVKIDNNPELSKYIADYNRKFLLTDKYPWVEKYWDYDNNKLEPEQTVIMSESKDVINLKCPICGYKFTRKMASLPRTEPYDYCALCRRLSRIKEIVPYVYGTSSILLTDPVFDLDSTDKLQWKCPVCDNIFEVSPKGIMQRNDYICLICRERDRRLNNLPDVAIYYSPGLTEQPLSEINWKDGYNNLTWQCPDCKQVFSKTPNGLRRGNQ